MAHAIHTECRYCIGVGANTRSDLMTSFRVHNLDYFCIDASCVSPRTALRASFLPRSRPAQRGAARLSSGPASPARRRKTPKQPAAMRTLKHPAATSPNPLSKHPRIAGVCVFLALSHVNSTNRKSKIRLGKTKYHYLRYRNRCH